MWQLAHHSFLRNQWSWTMIDHQSYHFFLSSSTIVPIASKFGMVVSSAMTERPWIVRSPYYWASGRLIRLYLICLQLKNAGNHDFRIFQLRVFLVLGYGVRKEYYTIFASKYLVSPEVIKHSRIIF
jgi:hypothetical protein